MATCKACGGSGKVESKEEGHPKPKGKSPDISTRPKDKEDWKRKPKEPVERWTVTRKRKKTDLNTKPKTYKEENDWHRHTKPEDKKRVGIGGPKKPVKTYKNKKDK